MPDSQGGGAHGGGSRAVGRTVSPNTGHEASRDRGQHERWVTMPETVSDLQAASVMLKGLTASNIINRIYRPAAGDTVLIHAAASGVGLLLTQWCKHYGASVIGTVGNEAKAQIARDHGLDHAIRYRETDFVQAVQANIPEGVRPVLEAAGTDKLHPPTDFPAPLGTPVKPGAPPGNNVMIELDHLQIGDQVFE